jgi:5-methylcytosine-specific restriction endonuclease McrA
METGCQRCGYREHPVALEFDHIDPLTKKYSIGSQLMSMSWKSLHEEISKCQVLCANCHQIHTHESNHYATRRIN